MTDKNHLDSDYSKIDALYISYIQALNQSNNQDFILQTRQKIIVTFWKILKKAKSVTPEMSEHTELMIDKIDYCLEHFHEETNSGFGKYTYTSVLRALKMRAEETQFAEVNGGMSISDNTNRKRRKILKLYRLFQENKKGTEKEFISYALSCIDCSEEEIITAIHPYEVTGIVVNNEDGDEVFLTDLLPMPSFEGEQEKLYQSTEIINEKLIQIDRLWMKQKESAKPFLSELLTREILYSNQHEVVLRKLANFEFICKEMLREYLSNRDYKLVTQQEIADKYGITKSGASKKLSRFIEDLKD